MAKQGKSTIADVARLANVAKSTVSRVLNGGSASARAKLRVEQSVRQLNFSASSVARNLSIGRTGVVGFVVENLLGEEWLYELMQGMEEQSSPRHLALMLGSLAPAGKYDASMVEEWIDGRRVDGLIFAKPGTREAPLLRKAQAAGLPVAAISPDCELPGSTVLRSRNEEAGLALGRHLCGLGHRRVEFLGGPKESLDSRLRLAGLKEALAECGAKLISETHASYLIDDGTQYAGDWLAKPKSSRGTAVVAANDAMAIGFIQALQGAGHSVPGDVSVTGFDDLPLSKMIRPALTTMRQQLRPMGATAMFGLQQSLNNPKNSQGSYQEFPMELVVRQSTGRLG
jgi:LacI family transcriptional regulator